MNRFFPTGGPDHQGERRGRGCVEAPSEARARQAALCLVACLEPATLHRVLRGLIGSEATHVEVKLIKRTVAPGKASPFLNFSSKGVVDLISPSPKRAAMKQMRRSPGKSPQAKAKAKAKAGKGPAAAASRMRAFLAEESSAASGVAEVDDEGKPIMVATVTDMYSANLTGNAPGAMSAEIEEAIQATFDAAMPRFAMPNAPAMALEPVGSETSGEESGWVSSAFTPSPW